MQNCLASGPSQSDPCPERGNHRRRRIEYDERNRSAVGHIQRCQPGAEARKEAQGRATEAPGCARQGQVGEEGRPAKRAPKAPKAAKVAKGERKAGAAREGSKSAKVLDLLRRPDGATLKEIMKATGWQPHSVRGFISGTLGKKMGLTVESTKREDGERVYSLAQVALPCPVCPPGSAAAGFSASCFRIS